MRPVGCVDERVGTPPRLNGMKPTSSTGRRKRVPGKMSKPTPPFTHNSFREEPGPLRPDFRSSPLSSEYVRFSLYSAPTSGKIVRGPMTKGYLTATPKERLVRS